MQTFFKFISQSSSREYTTRNIPLLIFCITKEVQDEKRRISLLVQGGLEIAIHMIVFWNNFNNIEILRQKIASEIFQEYNDESRIFYGNLKL